MFWADRVVEDVLKDRQKYERGGKIIIRDEKTASGRIHVGSMRGVAIHGTIAELFTEKGEPHEYLYEINDMDPMDDLPAYLSQEKFSEHLGKPLYKIPSPDGIAKNYAEYFAEEFIGVIKDSGYAPTYYRTSELYASGRMNEAIELALKHADTIRTIYKEVSGSTREGEWLPFHVVCEQCGKVATTNVSDFDGQTVKYICSLDKLDYTKGCGKEGRISPLNGNGKLPWKVEWAAKWKVLGVGLEGAGKDHSTKGGARDVANHIARDVYHIELPFDIPYEFFLVGGKKMSSSKGRGSSAREIADLIPPKIFRLALIGKDIKQAFNFDPGGETIPTLYDQYDKFGDLLASGVSDDFTRLFALIHRESERATIQTPKFLPRFSLVSFLVQMPHLELMSEVERMKGEKLTAEEQTELSERATYAKNWLTLYAPENYRYELQTNSIPESVKMITDAQKQSLRSLLAYVEGEPALDGAKLHEKLHELKAASTLSPGEFFSPLYLAFLGRTSGPKAGWFLSVLPRDFLIERLRAVVA